MSSSHRAPAIRDAQATPPKHAEPSTFRGYMDELVFVFVVVMFVKMFVVELYKIPSGSMTPTLLGGMVAEVDINGDGRKDLAYWESSRSSPALVFLDDGRMKRLALGVQLDPFRVREWQADGTIRAVYDRILVDKMAYWLGAPRRGDVVVFKVPDPPFTPEAPIFIKRLTGLAGERLSFRLDPGANEAQLGQLVVNGKPVDSPEFYKYWRYRSVIPPADRLTNCLDLPFVHYSDLPNGWRNLDRIDVPTGQVFVMGDNTLGSLDSRYWGGVPMENLKGRAFLRVWPLRRAGWIH
jgi:signal peptidase I